MTSQQKNQVDHHKLFGIRAAMSDAMEDGTIQTMCAVGQRYPKITTARWFTASCPVHPASGFTTSICTAGFALVDMPNMMEPLSDIMMVEIDKTHETGASTFQLLEISTPAPSIGKTANRFSHIMCAFRHYDIVLMPFLPLWSRPHMV